MLFALVFAFGRPIVTPNRRELLLRSLGNGHRGTLTPLLKEAHKPPLLAIEVLMVGTGFG